MAVQSVYAPYSGGPEWPLGFISVVTPGTPVGIMSLVDPGSVNAPNNASPPAKILERSIRAHQITFQAFKQGASHGLQNNAGNVYIVLPAQGSGSGNRDDYGCMSFVLTPGQTRILEIEEGGTGDINPYDYSVDADNSGDGVLVTMQMVS